MLASNLKEKNDGKLHVLSDAAWSALVRANKDNIISESGFTEHSSRQTATRHKNKSRRYVRFTCTENLYQRSIFGINNLAPYNDPCIVNAVNINSVGISFNWFTNLLPFNTADGYGLCKPIDFYEPILLYVSDQSNFPQCGMPCGPDINTDQWGISGNSYGLICISNPSNDPQTLNNVWCLRTPDPIGITGIVYQNDIKPWQGGSNPLSTGQITVLARNSQNELVPIIGPGETNLTLPVYHSGNSAFKVGQIVKCLAVTGVGLLIIDSASLTYGRAEQNISHANAGLVNLYTGEPGAEIISDSNPVLAFNYLTEVTAGEWVFLLPSGANVPIETEVTEEGLPIEETVGETQELEQTIETEIPEDIIVQYYIVASSYSGKILGRVIADSFSEDDNTVGVAVYGGIPGSEIATGAEITAYVGQQGFIGAISNESWVTAIFLGGGPYEFNGNIVEANGGWYIIASQRSNIWAGQVQVGQANSNGYIAVDEDVQIQLLQGVDADLTNGITVNARVIFAPLIEYEKVMIEWTGDCFVVTRAELDGGFYAKANAQINNGSSGKVATLPIPNSPNVQVSSLLVDTQEGNVESGRTVFVFRNRGGFHIGSKSCS